MERCSLTFVLLAATVCISVGGLAVVANVSPTEFVHDNCKATRYPVLCEQCLASYASKVRQSKRELARAALAVSADRARTASIFVSRMSTSPVGGGGKKALRSQEAGAVRDCIDTMRDGVDRLRRSVQEMGRMRRAQSFRFTWHLSNVQTWVSAALTDETTCLDGLSQFAGATVRAAIRKKVVEVAQVTSNALALVNQLGTKK